VNCRVKVCSGPILPDVVALAAKKEGSGGLALKNRGSDLSSTSILKSALPVRCSLEPLAGLTEALRMVKSEAEIALIRRSSRSTRRPFEAALRTVRPGRTRELDLAAEIDHRMRKLGRIGLPLKPSSLQDPRSALPHAQPSQRIAMQK
jgi:Xaa-Pro aminopeptidase